MTTATQGGLANIIVARTSRFNPVCLREAGDGGVTLRWSRYDAPIRPLTIERLAAWAELDEELFARKDGYIYLHIPEGIA